MIPGRLAEIVVTGFPKCGTTALMDALERDPGVTTLRSTSGKIEVPWPEIKALRPAAHPAGILAHKFTAYVYNDEALRYLVGVNPDSILAICVRDPLKSLVSWHKMHQSIARSGRNPEHFAYKERDFYAECSILEYWNRFAKSRLRYDLHFDRMVSIAPPERIAVVSQERMARGIGLVADYLKSLARGSAPLDIEAAEALETAEAHKGYADRARSTVPRPIQSDLKRVRAKLSAAIASSRVHHCL